MRALLAAAALVVLPAVAHAESDLQLWTAAGVTYRVAPRTRLEAALELRSDQDISRLGSVLPSIGVNYAPSSLIRLGAGYRFEYERDREGNLDRSHRLHTDFSILGDAGPVGLRYRLRLQARLQDRPTRLDTNYTIRNRLGISYDIGRPVTPGMSVELFTRVGDEDSVQNTKYRFTIDAEYDAGEHEVEVFYRIEVPANDRTDPVLHIIGIGYELDLPLKKRGRTRPGR